MDPLVGVWVSKDLVNMNAVFDLLSVTCEKREKIRRYPVTVIIEELDAKKGYKIITHVADLTRDVSFPIGQDVETVSLFNHPCKAKLTSLGCSNVQEVQKVPEGELIIDRTLHEGKLVVTITAKKPCGGTATGKVMFQNKLQ